MPRKMRSKSPEKRKPKRAVKPVVDPRQIGLFDSLDAPPTTPARVRRVKDKRLKQTDPEASARPVVFSPREAAQYLGVSVSTLKNWRAKKMGPKWTLCGARLVAYRPADLEKFLDDNSAKR